MPSLRDLVARISFQTNTKPLVDVQAQLQGIKNRLSFLATTQALRWAEDMADKFGQFAYSIRNGAAQAGITTEAFQKLSYAAAQNGIKQDELAGVLAGLNQRLYDVRMGSDQAALAFAQAGISSGTLSTFRNGKDALLALGASLNRIQDPIRRTGVAQQLLGSQSEQLLEAMKNGKTGLDALSKSSAAANNVLSESQVKSLIKAQNALNAFRQQVLVATAKIAVKLAPVFKLIVDKVAAVRAAFKGMGGLNFGNLTYKLGFVYGAVRRFAIIIIESLRTAGGALWSFGKDNHIFDGLVMAVKLAAVVVSQILKTLGEMLGAAAFSVKDAIDSAITELADIRNAAADVFGSLQMLFDKFSLTRLIETFRAGFHLITEIIFAPFKLIAKIFPSIERVIDAFVESIGGKGDLQEALSGLTGTDTDSSDIMRDVASAKARRKLMQSPLFDMMANMKTQSDLQQSMFDMRSKVPPQDVKVNAPVSVTINGDANKGPVVDAIKSAISDHFDKVRTQTQVIATPGMAY